MDFYRALIADQQKRYSLEKNELIEFEFNNSIQRLRRYQDFYTGLANVVLTDRVTNSIHEGSFKITDYSLTVRINKIQLKGQFDKFLIMVRPSDEFFDFDQITIDEIDESMLDQPEDLFYED